MKLKFHIINAFSCGRLTGNPAAVCVIDEWLDDDLMQAIAAQHNLSETAFVRVAGDDLAIRWFTPSVEVDLCGHATLASAWVLFNHHQPETQMLELGSRSGPLRVRRVAHASGEALIQLDFPRREVAAIPMQAAVAQALGAEPLALWRSSDLIAEFADAATVRDLKPDFTAMLRLEGRGLIATAPGDDCDFVSRWFGPKVGVNEDPVTGSAHCSLVPLWSQQLGKTQHHARQLSSRGGELFCELAGDRVLIGGRAECYAEGEIYLS
ncbi:MAG: PhzF family phenazine biosynthesis protein [Wenzhouxiangellaceae bacterium]